MLRNIIKYTIIGIGIILMSVVLWYGDDAIKDSESLQKYIVMPFILTGGILAILGFIAALIYYTINLIDNFNPKIIWIISGAIILYVVSYLLASSETCPPEITATTCKQVGSGLILFYLLICTAIGAIVYTELSKVFSK